MTYKGVVRDKAIELNERLPYVDGQVVNVSVEPVGDGLQTGSPASIRAGMSALPQIALDAIDDLERAIESARIPVRNRGEFDDHE